MSDRLATMDDEELGGSIGVAFGTLDWPPTPDLAPRVAESIRQARRAGIDHIPLRIPHRRRTPKQSRRPAVVAGPWGGSNTVSAAQSELDELLDKISATGMNSLSKSEKERLNELSKRLRGM